MEYVEYVIKGFVLFILFILFVGSFIEKTAPDGYEDERGWHDGTKK